WNLDPRGDVGGNENHYSSTPTPAILHNYYQRKLTPSLRRGVAYKGFTHTKHTAYHFAASLPDAQIDRYQSTDQIVNAFGGASRLSNNIMASHGAHIRNLIKSVDSRYLDKIKME